MAPQTKRNVLIAGGIGGAALLAWLYLNKGNKGIQVFEPEGYVDPSYVPEYLTYNLGPGATPGANGNRPAINFGDINIGGGGASTPFRACNPQPFVPMPTPTGINTTINIPQIQPPAPPTARPTIDPYVIKPYNKYKCDVKQIRDDLNTISELIGVSVDEIFNENLYLGMKYMWYNTPVQDPKFVLRDANGEVIAVSNYYDPYNDVGVKAKRVRYTLEMACECKKGNKEFCGQYLSPVLFETAYGLEGN